MPPSPVLLQGELQRKPLCSEAKASPCAGMDVFQAHSQQCAWIAADKDKESLLEGVAGPFCPGKKRLLFKGTWQSTCIKAAPISICAATSFWLSCSGWHALPGVSLRKNACGPERSNFAMTENPVHKAKKHFSQGSVTAPFYLSSVSFQWWRWLLASVSFQSSFFWDGAHLIIFPCKPY